MPSFCAFGGGGCTCGFFKVFAIDSGSGAVLGGSPAAALNISTKYCVSSSILHALRNHLYYKYIALTQTMQHQNNIAVLVNLRVLGQLQPNDRVRADSNYLEIESRWGLSSFLRWWRADSREKTLSRIQDVMAHACQIKGTDKLIASAREGLQQLINTTYADDPLTVARLEVVLASTAAVNPAPRAEPAPRAARPASNLSLSLPTLPCQISTSPQERRF